MERVDFYLVYHQCRHIIDDCDDRINDELSSQPKFINVVLNDFFVEMRKDGLGMDPSQANLIVNGIERMPGDIRRYYASEENLEKLARCIEDTLLPAMQHPGNLLNKLRQHMLMDEELINALGAPFVIASIPQTVHDQAMYLARIIQYAMTRPFFPRDRETGRIIVPSWYTPEVSEYLRPTHIPKPCAYFGGRDQELEDMDQIIKRERIIALHGIPGIGKSQLAYKYIELHKKDYRSIIFIEYRGDLCKDVLDLTLASDIPNESSEERFLKHERFLQMLSADNLLVINDMNKVLEDEPYMDTIFNLDCRVLITTQCRFDCISTYELKEIQDIRHIVTIMDQIHATSWRDHKVRTEIIERLDRHTMAVVLIAHLMKRGHYSDVDILNKLKKHRIRLNITDRLSFKHRNTRRQVSFYAHMQFVFALYRLTEVETDVMRNMVLVPSHGIDANIMRECLNLDTMDAVNSLIDIGLIQLEEEDTIKLHPIIKQMAHEEYQPSPRNCAILVEKVQMFCHTLEDFPWHASLFGLVEEMITAFKKEHLDRYIYMLEDVYECMGKHRYYSGQNAIRQELQKILDDGMVGNAIDRALLRDYIAMTETDPNERIKLRTEALELLPLDNKRAKEAESNIRFNRAQDYYLLNQYSLALEEAEQSAELTRSYIQGNTINSMWQKLFLAKLYIETRENNRGLTLLEEVQQVIQAAQIDDTEMRRMQDVIDALYEIVQ